MAHCPQTLKILTAGPHKKKLQNPVGTGKVQKATCSKNHADRQNSFDQTIGYARDDVSMRLLLLSFQTNSALHSVKYDKKIIQMTKMPITVKKKRKRKRWNYMFLLKDYGLQATNARDMI